MSAFLKQRRTHLLVLVLFILLIGGFALTAQAIWDGDCDGGTIRFRYIGNGNYQEYCDFFNPPLPSQPPIPTSEIFIGNVSTIIDTADPGQNACPNWNSAYITKGAWKYGLTNYDTECGARSTIAGPPNGDGSNSINGVVDFMIRNDVCPPSFQQVGIDGSTRFCQAKKSFEYNTGGQTQTRPVVTDITLNNGSSCPGGYTKSGPTRNGKSLCYQRQNVTFKTDYSSELQCSTTVSPPIEIQPGQEITFDAQGGSGSFSWSAPGGSPSGGSNANFTTEWSTPGNKTVTVSRGGQQAECPPVEVEQAGQCDFDVELRIDGNANSNITVQGGAEEIYRAELINYNPNTGECVPFTTARRFSIDFDNNGSWDNDNDGRGISGWTNCTHSMGSCGNMGGSRWRQTFNNPPTGQTTVRTRLEWRNNFDCAPGMDKYNDPANPGRFICAAYDTANVTVEAPPPTEATLSVGATLDGSSANGVGISRISGTAGTGGSTAYDRTRTTNISTILHAPSTHTTGNFTGWSGCDSITTGGDCNAQVNLGQVQNVTANYVTPEPGACSFTTLLESWKEGVWSGANGRTFGTGEDIRVRSRIANPTADCDTDAGENNKRFFFNNTGGNPYGAQSTGWRTELNSWTGLNQFIVNFSSAGMKNTTGAARWRSNQGTNPDHPLAQDEDNLSLNILFVPPENGSIWVTHNYPGAISWTGSGPKSFSETDWEMEPFPHTRIFSNMPTQVGYTISNITRSGANTHYLNTICTGGVGCKNVANDSNPQDQQLLPSGGIIDWQLSFAPYSTDLKARQSGVGNYLNNVEVMPDTVLDVQLTNSGGLTGCEAGGDYTGWSGSKAWTEGTHTYGNAVTVDQEGALTITCDKRGGGTVSDTVNVTFPECIDGDDNDGDGDTDEDDPQCHQDCDPNGPYLPNQDEDRICTQTGEGQCSDNIDNDGDGRFDEGDPACYEEFDLEQTYHADWPEGPKPECSDQIDNDGDGFIDEPADPECESFADDSEREGPSFEEI